MRLLAPTAGRGVAPFVGIGGGVASYGLGTGGAVVLPGEEAQYPGDTDRRLTVNAAFGIDILPSMSVFGTPSGFRLEVIDQVALRSPFVQLDGGAFDPVHNVRVSLSLVGLVNLFH
jgi:hypothetical protein